MEALKINWESIESVYVADETYENINAPQWVDLSAPLNSDDADADAAWFCKPDCKHPKTAEDFLRSAPTPSKLLKSVSVSKLIALGDWTRNRDPYLKRRKPAPPQEEEEDGENQNPNLGDGGREMNENRSTRDVLGGRDLLGKISELYNELKKMGTTTTKPKDDDCLLLLQEKKQTPKNTLSRRGDEENNNAPLSLDLKKKKKKGELGIRTSPPTPQCFSVTPKPTRLNNKEREPFQEIQLRQVLLNQEKEEEEEEEAYKTPVGQKGNGKATAAAASALDVFWFFKPCANSAPEF